MHSYCKRNKAPAREMKPHVVPLLHKKRPQGFYFRMHARLSVCCFLTDVAEAMQAIGHSRTTKLLGSSVQDKREKRHTVHHGPFHQFCNCNDSSFRSTRATLDWTRGGTSVPAELLKLKRHVRRETDLGVCHFHTIGYVSLPLSGEDENGWHQVVD